MSDLIDDPREGENAPEFSVTELSGAIKRMIEGEFSHVRIKGEIGRVSFPRSGHVYLDLFQQLFELISDVPRAFHAPILNVVLVTPLSAVIRLQPLRVNVE